MDGVQDHCDKEDHAEDLGSIRNTGALKSMCGDEGGCATMLIFFLEYQRKGYQET